MISLAARRRAEITLSLVAKRPDLVVSLPLALGSAANARGHTLHRSGSTRKQRDAAHLALKRPARVLLAEAELTERPVTVRLVRMAPRGLDDDNLSGALKAIRDGVTDAFGLKSDRTPFLRFVADEDRTGANERPHVLVEVYRL